MSGSSKWLFGNQVYNPDRIERLSSDMGLSLAISEFLMWSMTGLSGVEEESVLYHMSDVDTSDQRCMSGPYSM